MYLNPAAARPNPEVVVVGESLIDVIETAAGPAEFPGGSGMNVAFGLGRLGITTSLLTALGNDAHGRVICRHLDSAGVQVMAGAMHLNRTSTATAVLDHTGSATYDFDLEWSLPEFSPTSLPAVLHTGSLATFLEPGASRVRRLLEAITGRCLITYDPNIRPGLLGSHSETVATFEDISALTNVVKLSVEDAHWLYPGQAAQSIARRLLALGCDLAVVTNGADGSYLCSRTSEVSMLPPRVTVADTVGAGDSYMAALIAGLVQEFEGGFDYGRLTRLGTAASLAAAITVGRHGANPPTRAELNASMELTDSSGKGSND
ncbi:carbohydrate kinase family protein [Arthrobacter sp. MA-N2]|uniref:carbohydrate kinase family protein n=1 Tax=Arthrobacter sp. MA-N2 TaxID=1101188 RepID=UPI000480ADC8|nr:carbohydrate kinase [Arthrobacter sp. MA-N2]